jgi:PAS domain S-box-containing protein
VGFCANFLVKRHNKTKDQLAQELEAAKQRVAELEKAAAAVNTQPNTTLPDLKGLYHDLFEHAGDLILIVDLPTLRILDANKQVLHRLGYSRSELLNLKIDQIEILEAIDSLSPLAWESTGSGTRMYKCHYRRKDGSLMPAEVSSRLFVRDDRELLHHIVRDITKNLLAEQILAKQNEALQALYNGALDISSHLEMSGLLRRIMKRATDLLEADRGGGIYLYDADEGVLRLVETEGIDQERANVTLKPNEGLSGRVFRSSQPLIVNDYTNWEGRAAVLIPDPPSAMMGVPLFSQGKTIGVLTLIANSHNRTFGKVDVQLAELIAAQASVAIQNARLFEQAQQEITRAGKLIEELDAFAHTVAHDLKNPLALMLGFSHLLISELDQLSPAETQECVQAINQSGKKMWSIVEELLLLASVRQLDEVETEPLDMSSIVSEAMERLQLLIAQNKARIIIQKADEWPSAIGYASWVEEVWANYISNAIKYGGAPPQVELGATVQDDGMARFWVKDNGPGIAAEDQTRIFDQFERLEIKGVSGHGLGLSIARRIVERLGGQVGVESSVGSGSTFYFTLPASN